MPESGSKLHESPKRSHWGIRHKVLGLVVLAAVLPTALVGSMSYWTARSTLMEKLSDQLNTRAALAAAKVSEWLQERRHDARVFADSSILASNVEKANTGSTTARALIDAYLEEVAGRYDVYRSLAVVDGGGELVAAAGTSGNDEMMGRAELHLARDASLEWTEDGSLLWLSRPLLGEGDVPAGWLLLVCDFETLRKTVADSDNPGRFRLSGASGHVLLEHPNALKSPVDLSQLDSGEGVIVELRDARGVAVLATSRTVESVDALEPLTLTVTLDREVAFASVTELRGRVFLLSALTVLLVVALAYGLVASLIDPLERLTASARAVARGDYGEGLPVRSRDEIGYLTEVFNQMTSTLKASHEHLEHLSTTDELTQLSNRRELQTALAEELARASRTAKSLAVIMIDIDHFKSFNDRFGHLRGDEFLASLGAYLRANLPGGAHAARYGGEEFLVILPETTIAEATECAETLRVGFSRECAEEVTLSLGVASWTGKGITAAELIDAADRALYRAKDEGRNRVVAAFEGSGETTEALARA